MVRTTLALVTMVGVVLAGCGDGDDGAASAEDVAKIERTLKAGTTATDPELECVKLVTERYVKDMYGDVEACRKAEAPREDEEVATDARITGTEVDGDEASAKLTTVGGDADGATGTFMLVKADGEWKVDRIGVDFLRSSLERSFENAEPETLPEALGTADGRTCVVEKLAAGDEQAFRDFVRDITIETPEALERFTSTLEQCGEGATAG